MKRFTLSLFVLLITFPAFAGGGGSYDNGGCTAGQTSSFCSMIGLVFAFLVVFVIVGSVYHSYKMRTDPAYRARDAEMMREYNEKHTRRF